MAITTQSEFARMCGKSRQYINRRIKEGLIGMLGKGRAARVNLDSGKTVAFLELCRQNDEVKQASLTDPPAPPVAKPKKKKPRKRQPSVPPPPPPPPEEPPPLPPEFLQGLDLDELSDGIVASLQCLTKLDLDRLKTIEAIRAQKQKTALSRKELVPRTSVQKVFSKLYMVDVNQFRTLDQNLIPEIAAIFGNEDPAKINEASRVMSKEVFKILAQRKRLLNDWLKEHEAEEIEDGGEDITDAT